MRSGTTTTTRRMKNDFSARKSRLRVSQKAPKPAAGVSRKARKYSNAYAFQLGEPSWMRRFSGSALAAASAAACACPAASTPAPSLGPFDTASSVLTRPDARDFLEVALAAEGRGEAAVVVGLGRGLRLVARLGRAARLGRVARLGARAAGAA